MATRVLDPAVEARLIEDRRARGADKFDEVWEGVYVLSPLANNEHQQVVTGLSYALEVAIALPGLGVVYAGVNVTDQPENWEHNYRCPDVAVFLQGTAAIDRKTHWLGGPDFAVEVINPGDRSRQKLDFYARVRTRELLLVDRDPWALELYRLEGDRLPLVGRLGVGDPSLLASEVVPLVFRFVDRPGRPMIEVVARGGQVLRTI